MPGLETEEHGKVRQEILNAVAHELGTPLTPVLIHIRRMQELAEGHQEMEESLKVVARNTDRLIDRLRSIIQVTQLDSGHFPVKMHTVEFVPLVEQFIDEYRPAAKAAGLRIEFHKRSSADVHCDPQRMGEVVANILDNAIRFSPTGSKIMVTAEDDSVHATLSVKDWGVGFEPKDRDKIFGAFSQLETGLAHAYQGAGLGLYISKGIIDLHRGEIEAHSEGPGKGATFIVKLHVARPSPVPIVWDDSSKEVAFYERIRDLV